MIFFIFESFLGILDKKASLKRVFSCHSRDHSATITDVIDGSLSGTFPALTETTPPKGRVVTFIRLMARGVNLLV